MNIITIIPARMGSSRFPGKPMTEILGKPMIEHVYRNVRDTPGVAKTVVATCDKEIFDYIQSIGGFAVMTSKTHERASDRCAEALQIIQEKDNTTYDIMIMVQGDEPLICSEMLSESIQPMLSDKEVMITNLFAEIKSKEEFIDPNCIKVVIDRFNNAMYFSRSPIPNSNLFESNKYYKQVCVIPFRREYLEKYNSMNQTNLEKLESIDMLRVIENGDKVKMVKTKYSNTHAVDNPRDIGIVEEILLSKMK